MGRVGTSPIHLLPSELAEMLKKVAPHWLAIAFPMSVCRGGGRS